MLPKNYIIEEKMMNGSIFTVVDIMYDKSRGPNQEGRLPMYVVVSFPEGTPSHIFMEGYPIICIRILVTTDKYENKCGSMTKIPLHVCNNITIFKRQGLTVGYGKLRENVGVWLPTGTLRRTPGT